MLVEIVYKLFTNCGNRHIHTYKKLVNVDCQERLHACYTVAKNMLRRIVKNYTALVQTALPSYTAI